MDVHATRPYRKERAGAGRKRVRRKTCEENVQKRHAGIYTGGEGQEWRGPDVADIPEGAATHRCNGGESSKEETQERRTRRGCMRGGVDGGQRTGARNKKEEKSGDYVEANRGRWCKKTRKRAEAPAMRRHGVRDLRRKRTNVRRRGRRK